MVSFLRSHRDVSIPGKRGIYKLPFSSVDALYQYFLGTLSYNG
jgi:hypothetical protein